MKKISLILAFVLLVAVLAISAFATTEQEAGNAVTPAYNITGAVDRIVHDGTSKVDTDYLIDGNYSTATSIANTNNWGGYINYHFFYEDEIALSKVVVVVNSTGKVLYKDANGEEQVIKEYTSTSALGSIYCRLYDKSDTVVYKLEGVNTSKATELTDENGNKYYAYTFDLDGILRKDIYKVEIATLGSAAESCVWEIEIYGYDCAGGSHNWDGNDCETVKTCVLCGATAEGHAWTPATCVAPKTCAVCGKTDGEELAEHEWVDATCIVAEHCKVCNAIGDDDATGVHNYTIVKKVEQPTCVQGYTVYSCETCSSTEIRDYKAPVYAHDFKLYRQTTKLPTATEAGAKEYVCQSCGGTTSVVVPAYDRCSLINIASWAKLTTNSVTWTIAGELLDGVTKVNLPRVVDGDYGTGVGSGFRDQSYSIYLTFDQGYVFEKVVFWFNQTAE